MKHLCDTCEKSCKQNDAWVEMCKGYKRKKEVKK